MADECALESEKTGLNVPEFFSKNSEQPTNTDTQSKEYYNGLKATWVNIGSLNPLANEFIQKIKNIEWNVPVSYDKGHGHSCLGDW